MRKSSCQAPNIRGKEKDGGDGQGADSDAVETTIFAITREKRGAEDSAQWMGESVS